MAFIRTLLPITLLVLGCESPPSVPEIIVGPVVDGAVADAPIGADDSGPVCAQSWIDESARWASCMKFSEWEATGMGTVAFQETEYGPCHTCHRSGVGGNYLNENSRDTFENIHELPYLGMLVLGNYDDDECFVELIRSTRLLNKDDAPSTYHPGFDWDEDRENAIVHFFDLTHARYLVGDCE